MWASLSLNARFWRGILGAVLLLCWLLLNVHLEGKSLWADEMFTAELTHLPAEELVERTANDFHPPLYFLLVKVWSTLAGRSDFALRWPSVAAGWLSVGVLYRLAKRLGGARVALLAAGLWAISPALILYARMARYYSLTALLVLLATWALVRALRDNVPGRWHPWISYIVASSAAIFTFYLSGLVVLAHGWVVLLTRCRQMLLRWVIAVLTVTILLVPWAGIVVRQVVRTGSGAADLASGVAGLVMKAVYTAYAFLVGESLFPWHAVAVVGAVCAVSLVIAGLIGWRRQRLTATVVGLVAIPAPLLMLIITQISPRTPFISAPARALFVAPLLFLLAAGATLRFRARWLVLPLLGIVLAWGTSLYNYYQNTEFLNPIYLTPAREMVQFVVERLQPGDIVYSDVDIGFNYYYQQAHATPPHFADSGEALADIKTGQVHRIWLVTMGRDQTRFQYAGSSAFYDWLESHCSLAAEWGFIPQDETYRTIKSYLLGRPAYDYRAAIALYEQCRVGR